MEHKCLMTLLNWLVIVGCRQLRCIARWVIHNRCGSLGIRVTLESPQTVVTSNPRNGSAHFNEELPSIATSSGASHLRIPKALLRNLLNSTTENSTSLAIQRKEFSERDVIKFQSHRFLKSATKWLMGKRRRTVTAKQICFSRSQSVRSNESHSKANSNLGAIRFGDMDLRNCSASKVQHKKRNLFTFVTTSINSMRIIIQWQFTAQPNLSILISKTFRLTSKWMFSVIKEWIFVPKKMAFLMVLAFILDRIFQQESEKRHRTQIFSMIFHTIWFPYSRNRTNEFLHKLLNFCFFFVCDVSRIAWWMFCSKFL